MNWRGWYFWKGRILTVLVSLFSKFLGWIILITLLYPANYDLTIVIQFMKLFPTSPMASLLKGYFTYMGISLFDEEDEDKKQLEAVEEDPFDMILVSASVNSFTFPYPFIFPAECILCSVRLYTFQSSLGRAIHQWGGLWKCDQGGRKWAGTFEQVWSFYWSQAPQVRPCNIIFDTSPNTVL